MKLKWSNYELAKSFDEYITSKRSVRKHIKKIGNFFESLTLNELKDLDSATESAIKSLGINFRIYSETGSEERSWPLDFIPRIIKKSEWDKVSKGLKQRSKALNLFIEDCYNEQRFLKSSAINSNLILKSKAYFSFCKNIKLLSMLGEREEFKKFINSSIQNNVKLDYIKKKKFPHYSQEKIFRSC